MTNIPKQKPGPYGPGSTVVPLEFLGSPAVPFPHQTLSGFGFSHGTTTFAVEVDICNRVRFRANPTDVTDGPRVSSVAMAAAWAAPGTLTATAALVAGVSWVAGMRARMVLLFVLIQFQGSACCWIWGMLVDEAPSHDADHSPDDDADDSSPAGVREPAANPPALPCAVMALPIPAPKPEAENAIGVGLNIDAGVPVPAGASALHKLLPTATSTWEEIMEPHGTEITAKDIGKSATGQWSTVRRAAVYVRVSAKVQDEDSLEAQLEACMKRADDDGFLVSPDRVYRERSTGSRTDCPILERLRRAMRAGEVCAVFVYSPDRLSRDPVHLIELMGEFASAGAGLHFVRGDTNCSLGDESLPYILGFASQTERLGHDELNDGPEV